MLIVNYKMVNHKTILIFIMNSTLCPLPYMLLTLSVPLEDEFGLRLWRRDPKNNLQLQSAVYPSSNLFLENIRGQNTVKFML